MNRMHKTTESSANKQFELKTVYTVSQKKTVKIVFFPRLCQMFTKFDNFWHEDGQGDEIMQFALIFHLI